MSDIISILTHPRAAMAKTWQQDGTIKNYSEAKFFKLTEREVSNIFDLSEMLQDLEAMPKSCLIRGRFTGDDAKSVRRLKGTFADQPLHAVMIEVDKYEPLTCDPVSAPDAACAEFVSAALPSIFQNVSYHWQLSNSAGKPGSEHLLKAHIWFWLSHPATSQQLRTWANEVNLDSDYSVFDEVQIHYTAMPIFEPGVVDPVARRSGYKLSARIEVDLDISALDVVERKIKLRGVVTEAAAKDDTAAFLHRHGLVLGQGADGQLHIKCPFSAGHGGKGNIDETSYFLAGTGGYETGRFTCFHHSCRKDHPHEHFVEALHVYDDDMEALPPLPQLPPIIENKRDWIGTARQLIKERLTVDGTTSVRFGQDQWYQYNAPIYERLDRVDMDGVISRFLDGAITFEMRKRKLEDGKQIIEKIAVPYLPNRANLGEVNDALKRLTKVKAFKEPMWLDGRTEIENYLALRDGILNIRTRELLAHTPQFFSTTQLPFNWRGSEGDAPAWAAFLESLWPGDDEVKGTMQEIFGYLLSSDTSMQKMFLLKGPPRSGKGTIARVLRGLLGSVNTVDTTFAQLASTPFGLESLLGKSVAFVPEARNVGNKHINMQVAVERMLSISGEDEVSVDRKGTTAWLGKLNARFVMMANELPALGDSSEAFASRFIVIGTTHSFLGREDTELTDKLMLELPQIMRWALDGYERVKLRGHFVTPKASLALTEELADVNNHARVFLKDCCEVGDFFTDKDVLYQHYRDWCGENNRFADAKNIFMRAIGNANSLIVSADTRVRGRSVRRVRGLRLLIEGADDALGLV